MSASGIFLFIAFFIVVGAIVAWPIFQRQRQAAPEGEQTELLAMNQLRSQHEAILRAIRDLDFDHQVGKLQEEDYQTQREILMQRAMDTLKQIDDHQAVLVDASIADYRAAKHQP